MPAFLPRHVKVKISNSTHILCHQTAQLTQLERPPLQKNFFFIEACNITLVLIQLSELGCFSGLDLPFLTDFLHITV